MNTQGLFELLNNISILSAGLQEQLKACLVEESFTRKQLLLKEGMVAQRIYFIKKGFVRAYHHNNGEKFTSWFMGEGEIIISVYSFFSRKPSFENIEILEDAVLQSINWDQLQNIYAAFPEFNFTGRIITEQYYIRSEEKMISMQTLTAKQRYEALLAAHPAILQKASLGQIASYLGIKQETLSRIRAGR
jgi:CRP-like cAMP-binding protein